MTISCVRHPSTGPAQPNGANASTKIPGPKSDARPYKQDRVRGFLAHALHGVHHNPGAGSTRHCRALATTRDPWPSCRARMETGSTPARWDRTKDCPRTWLWTIHRRADNCAGSPRRPRRVSRSRKWNRLKPGPPTGRDRARCARSCHPVAAARAAAPAAVDTPAAGEGAVPEPAPQHTTHWQSRLPTRTAFIIEIIPSW